MPKKSKAVTAYWLEHFVDKKHGLCTLCGNNGVVNTTGVCSPAGIPVGRRNFCICPNGQALRSQSYGLLDDPRPDELDTRV